MSTVRLEAVDLRGEVEIPLQPASWDIWDKKYRLTTKQGDAVDQAIDDTYRRVARALADVEETPDKREYWYERFTWALRRGAIPAGRITSNAGALAHKPATSTITGSTRTAARGSWPRAIFRAAASSGCSSQAASRSCGRSAASVRRGEPG